MKMTSPQRARSKVPQKKQSAQLWEERKGTCASPSTVFSIMKSERSTTARKEVFPKPREMGNKEWPK